MAFIQVKNISYRIFHTEAFVKLILYKVIRVLLMYELYFSWKYTPRYMLTNPPWSSG